MNDFAVPPPAQSGDRRECVGPIDEVCVEDLRKRFLSLSSDGVIDVGGTQRSLRAVSGESAAPDDRDRRRSRANGFRECDRRSQLRPSHDSHADGINARLADSAQRGGDEIVIDVAVQDGR